LPSTIEQVHREYQDMGLVVYAVNIQERRSVVEAFVKSKRLSVPVLLDPDGDASSDYRVSVTPTVYLVGRDGTLVAKGLGTKAWTSPPGRALLRRLLLP
jgi:hypothetical protein